MHMYAPQMTRLFELFKQVPISLEKFVMLSQVLLLTLNSHSS